MGLSHCFVTLTPAPFFLSLTDFLIGFKRIPKLVLGEIGGTRPQIALRLRHWPGY